MDNVRRYRPYRGRRSDRNDTVRKGVWAVVGLVVFILLWQGLRGSPKTKTNTPNSNISPLLTTNGSVTNSNTSLLATVPFSTAKCPGVISQYGDAKKIALTFNAAGTAPVATEKVRDALKQANASGTFFLSGTYVEQNAALTKSLSEAGFGVYNYTYDKPHPATLKPEDLTQQLARAEQTILDVTGKSPKPFFRPPYGEFNDSIIATTRAAGYCVIHWTVDAFDWQDGQTVDGSATRVEEKARPGAIVLLNLGSDLVADLVPRLVTDLRAKGYELVGLDGLVTS